MTAVVGYRRNKMLATLWASKLKGFPKKKHHPEFCYVTILFIHKVKRIVEEPGYILHTQPGYNLHILRSTIWDLIDAYIANELPFVLASRPVSQDVKETLNHELKLFWLMSYEIDYVLFDEVDKLIQTKIRIQLCCKRFLARKRLAELKRNFAIATASHPRLGEKSILATLTQDLLLACLI